MDVRFLIIALLVATTTSLTTTLSSTSISRTAHLIPHRPNSLTSRYYGDQTSTNTLARSSKDSVRCIAREGQANGHGYIYINHQLLSKPLASVPLTSWLADFNIALVDSTLHLLHFTRMPTAKLTSIQISIDKAFTAAGHRLPTSTYTNSPQAKNFLPGGPAYGIHNSNGGRFSIIGGGIPITIDGVVVGAIGVSTGTPAQDIECATAGVEAVERFVKRKGGAKL